MPYARRPGLHTGPSFQCCLPCLLRLPGSAACAPCTALHVSGSKVRAHLSAEELEALRCTARLEGSAFSLSYVSYLCLRKLQCGTAASALQLVGGNPGHVSRTSHRPSQLSSCYTGCYTGSVVACLCLRACCRGNDDARQPRARPGQGDLSGPGAEVGPEADACGGRPGRPTAHHPQMGAHWCGVSSVCMCTCCALCLCLYALINK